MGVEESQWGMVLLIDQSKLLTFLILSSQNKKLSTLISMYVSWIGCCLKTVGQRSHPWLIICHMWKQPFRLIASRLYFMYGMRHMQHELLYCNIMCCSFVASAIIIPFVITMACVYVCVVIPCQSQWQAQCTSLRQALNRSHMWCEYES